MRPRAEAALRTLAVGNGDVKLDQATTFDSRILVDYSIEHHTQNGIITTRFRLLHTPEGRGGPLCNILWADLLGTSKYLRVDVMRPLVLTRNPFTGKEDVLNPKGFTDFLAAFEELPRDERTAAEWQNLQQQLPSAITTYLGDWYGQGQCPKCGAQLMKAGEWISGLVGCSVLLAILGVGGYFGYRWLWPSGDQNPQLTEGGTQERPIRVGLKTVIDDYNQNELNADPKYKNRWIRIVGLVNRMRGDWGKDGKLAAGVVHLEGSAIATFKPEQQDPAELD